MWTDLLTYANFASFSQDQVQMFVCMYANFTHMQVLSCERKVKFAYVRKFINYAI